MLKRRIRLRAVIATIITIVIVGCAKGQPVAGILAAFGILLILLCLSTLWIAVCTEFCPCDSCKPAVLDKLIKESIFNW